MRQTNLQDEKGELFDLIKKKGIVLKDVILSSGVPSKYYYDLKPVVLSPRGSNLIGDLLLHEVLKFKGVKSVGGLEVGATLLVPIVTLKSSKLNLLDAFFVRKNPKRHGLEKEIEGNLIDPVVVVDDVVTTGKSVLQTLEKIAKEGIEVRGIVCVIDREEGAKELFKKHDIPFVPLFTHSDFKDYIESKTEPQKQNVEINSYA